MKRIIIIILLLTSFHCSGQTGSILARFRREQSYVDPTEDSICLAGINKARASYDATGIVTYYTIGLPSRYSTSASNFISRLYHIEMEGASCTAGNYLSCYNRFTDSILNAWCNCNFWEKAYESVDSARLLGLLDRPLMYRGGDSARINEFRNLLQKNGVNGKHVSVYCMLQIDSNGRLKDISYIKCQPSGKEKQIRKALSALSNWMPAMLSGQPVTEVVPFSYKAAD